MKGPDETLRQLRECARHQGECRRRDNEKKKRQSTEPDIDIPRANSSAFTSRLPDADLQR